MIIMSGAIGAGKSNLTTFVSKHLGTEAFFEPVGDNPILPLFYKDLIIMPFYFRFIS